MLGDMERQRTKRARSPGTHFRNDPDPWCHFDVPAGADGWSRTPPVALQCCNSVLKLKHEQGIPSAVGVEQDGVHEYEVYEVCMRGQAIHAIDRKRRGGDQTMAVLSEWKSAEGGCQAGVKRPLMGGWPEGGIADAGNEDLWFGFSFPCCSKRARGSSSEGVISLTERGVGRGESLRLLAAYSPPTSLSLSM